MVFMQRNKRLKYFVFAVLLTLLPACSVSFSQLDTIKLLFRVSDQSFSSVEWTAEWDGNFLPLYAVDSGFESVFVSGLDIRLYFSDLHFSEVVGILPNSQRAVIEKNGEEVSFWLDDELIARDTCEDWQLSEGVQVSKGYSIDRYIQYCSRLERASNSSEIITYQNEIDVDSNTSIARLKFVIHPEYSPIIISLVE